MMDPGPCTNSEPDLNLDQPTVLTPNWSFLTGTERKRNMSYTISGVDRKSGLHRCRHFHGPNVTASVHEKIAF